MVHFPVLPAREFDGKTGNGFRADALAQMDAYTGELIDTVEKLGFKENTIFIFTSDNGPEMNEPWNGWAGPRRAPISPPSKARCVSRSSSAGPARFPPAG